MHMHNNLFFFVIAVSCLLCPLKVVYGADVIISANTTWADAADVPAGIDNLTITNSATLTIGGGTYELSPILVVAAGTIRVVTDSHIVVVGEYTTTVATNPLCGYPDGHGHTLQAASIIIETNASINGDGQGYPAFPADILDYKGGPGTSSYKYLQGGTYGGYAWNYGPVGQIYGDPFNPLDLGTAGYQVSGAGAITLIVSGSLTVNGRLSVNGAPGGNGAGSGGSLLINTGLLAGGGRIQAKGGTGTGTGQGAAGGGRIYLSYTSKSFTGTISAGGGTSTTDSYGMPGTLVCSTNYIDGLQAIDDGGFALLPGVFTNGLITITNNSILLLQTVTGMTASLTFTASNVNIASGSRIAFGYGANNFCETNDLTTTNRTGGILNANNLTVDGQIVAGACVVNASTLTVTSNGVITANGKGFKADTYGSGPGAGGYCNGSSHGGLGSKNPGPTYDDPLYPSWLGSASSFANGGGLIQLIVNGTLNLKGQISANGGSNGQTGGAGGSILIRTSSFAGSGSINAIGGDESIYGAGGGGRVAIEYGVSSFTGTVSVAGGLGSVNPSGKAGTYFLCHSPYSGACFNGYQGVALRSGLSVNSGDNTTTNGVKITRSITNWRPSSGLFAWSDASTDFSTNQLNNTETNQFTGLWGNKVYEIRINGATTGTATSDVNGALMFILQITNATDSFVLAGPPPGIVFVVH